MSEDVRYMRGNDRTAGLARRPDVGADVGQIRRDVEDAERTYAMGLAVLRQAAHMTQIELARRKEQPHDLLLSILNSYLQAVGGRASVVLRFADGHQTELDLSQFA